MFKVSQEIQLNATGGSNNNNNNGLFGRYKRTDDNDKYYITENSTYVAPELTEAGKVQILHFPNETLPLHTNTHFVLKRNGVKGNFEVKIESPSGAVSIIPLQVIDPERFGVHINPSEVGVHKIYIKCNSVPLPGSPFLIVAVTRDDTTQSCVNLPVFHSDASKVTYRGTGLREINVNEKNEFILDGSTAGNNILFIGICGPKGQCDEVSIKHMGQNVYKVCYQVRDPGEYLIAAKWGDDHITGSPFRLITKNA